ncbi:GNAT family N-acetyltransferase [Vibrio sp. Of7-15]|uniref:GNAT family N-acetyltransferase n=1 Tax=Vibrio sp. Of7-15 TaxID=2724879 RepID=UPI001EF2A5A1|nr:GNAT family N-acetyltransferase [Vibrio sp. Of7-15]MCG7497692.1 GNAT family N-acetyltransferase [Vibrio sp. Of7-15]
MDIQKVVPTDLDTVASLVSEVSKIDIFPLLNAQGKEEFSERVIPDLCLTFNGENCLAIKAVSGGRLLGFAALRDGNYLTHLFISKEAQGAGLGRELLNHLLGSTDASEISLRSAVNSVSFYSHHGFVTTGDEAEFNGIRFVPMSLVRTHLAR